MTTSVMPEAEVRGRLAALMGPDWAERRAAWTGWDLRAARRVLGITQAEAAGVIGCHVNCISNWENGLSSPHPRHRRAVLAFLAIAEEAVA